MDPSVRKISLRGTLICEEPLQVGNFIREVQSPWQQRAGRMEAVESRARVEAWAGLAAEVAFLPLVPRKMLRPVWLWHYLGLCSLLLAQAEAPSPVEPPERSRPYAVLRGQNLVLMGTIFSILLVTVILMAFCVYKPIRRR